MVVPIELSAEYLPRQVGACQRYNFTRALVCLVPEQISLDSHTMLLGFKREPVPYFWASCAPATVCILLLMADRSQVRFSPLPWRRLTGLE